MEEFRKVDGRMKISFSPSRRHRHHFLLPILVSLTLFRTVICHFHFSFPLSIRNQRIHEIRVGRLSTIIHQQIVADEIVANQTKVQRKGQDYSLASPTGNKIHSG